MSFDYYVEKVTEMLKLASMARDPRARHEFERLAQEYRTLAKNAQDKPNAKQA